MIARNSEEHQDEDERGSRAGSRGEGSGASREEREKNNSIS